MNKNYNESEEMYLETILLLKEEKENIHAIDIANRMNFSRASVSRALQNLKNKGYIEVLEDDTISLLKEGEKYAENIYERHKTLKELLLHLGVDEENSEIDACKIEHVISNETFDIIKKFLEEANK